MTTTTETTTTEPAAPTATAVPEAPPPEASWPILDIGGCIGALIIHAGRDDVGSEIHLCPVGEPDHRSHNVVRERRSVGAVAYAAVFPSLPEGAYLVLADAGATDGERVVISGARVTEARWSPAASSAHAGGAGREASHHHPDGTTHSLPHHHNQRSHHHAC